MAASGAPKYQHAAIRTHGQFPVVAGCAGYLARIAAAARHPHDLTQVLVLPANIVDPGAIAAQRWKEFENVVFVTRQSRWFAGQRFAEKPAERFEDDDILAGDFLRPAWHSCLKAIGGDFHRKAWRRIDNAGIGDVKRDVGLRACRDVDPVNSTRGPIDDARGIRSEIHVRVHAVNGPAFLHVLIELVDEHSFRTGLEVFYE